MPKKKTAAGRQYQSRTQITLREADHRMAEELSRLFGISTIGDVVRLAANMLAGKIANNDAPSAEEVKYQPDDSPVFQTTMWLRDQDRSALEAAQRYYGIASIAATVRFSIAWLNWFFEKTKVTPPPNQSQG